MQEQTKPTLTGNKPSLESIFGTQAPSATRPPLDAILGVKKATVAPTETPTDPLFTPEVVDEIKTKSKEAIIDPFTERLEKIDYANQNFMSNGLQTTGAVVGGGFDVFLNGLKGAYEAVTPQNIQDDVKAKIQSGVARVADAIDPATLENIDAMAKAHPEIAGDLMAIMDIGLPKGLGDVSKTLEKAVRATEAFKKTKAVTGEAVDATGKAIVDAGKATTDALITNPVKDVVDFTVGLKDKTVNKAKSMVSPSEKIAEVASDPAIHPFIAQSPEHAKLVTDAVRQGFEPKEVKFLAGIGEADKTAMREMMDLAESGSTDLEKGLTGKRPADVVGDSVLKPLREIQNLNKTSGEAVDSTARALAGTNIDASAVGATAKTSLEKAGVSIKDAQTYAREVAQAALDNKPTPSRFNFDSSVFKKLPAIQKQLANALSDLPEGPMDAYDLHKFKKSIDQIVEYGKSSDKPLTREAENVLKEIRSSADEVLDTNFSAYNKANTDFKKTREVLDMAEETIGGKTDFMSSRANQQVGKAMRGMFANTNKRPELGNFLQMLKETSTEYGIVLDTDPAKQAVFAQVLEKMYGNQAVTGIQGEMSKALQTAIEFKTNPLMASVKKGAEIIDKLQGATEAEKKRVLRDFLKDNALK